tara:strand:+ start:1593 stop:2045 length:453 start_codon:yes stop_codon:yes gene_type:complete
MRIILKKGGPKITRLPKGEEVRFILKDDKQNYYVILNSGEYHGSGRLYVGLEGQELKKQNVSDYKHSKDRGIHETELKFSMKYIKTKKGRNGEKNKEETEMVNTIIRIPLDSYCIVGLYIEEKESRAFEEGEHFISVLERIVSMSTLVKK